MSSECIINQSVDPHRDKRDQHLIGSLSVVHSDLRDRVFGPCKSVFRSTTLPPTVGVENSAL